MTPDHRLYAIIGPEHAQGVALIEMVRAAARGGITLLQYRDKHNETRAMVDIARALKDALAGTAIPLLINDRVDVALAAEADGVHLGQSDMHPADARRLLGPSAIIGWTLKTHDHAQALSAMPVDYATIGGVYATTSKDNPDPPLGLAGFASVLKTARAASTIPIGAIAGIDATNAAALMQTGADGVAVISAIFKTPDPEHAARHLRGVIDGARA